MVLGFILYEGIDLTYHAVKMTYNGLYYLYNWNTNTNNNTNNEIIDISQNKIHQLENRIEELENLLYFEKMKNNEEINTIIRNNFNTELSKHNIKVTLKDK